MVHIPDERGDRKFGEFNNASMTSFIHADSFQS